MYIRTAILSAFLLPATTWAASIDAVSAIDKVTVFRDRAEVERVAHVDFDRGRHTLVFGAIPQSINSDSLKVSGLGSSEFQLVSIQQKTRFLEEDRSAEARAIQDQIDELELKTKSGARKKARLERELTLLNQIQLSQDVPASDHILTPRTPKDLHEILTLVGANGERLDSQIEALENDLQLMAKKIGLLRARLGQFGSTKRSESIVEVKLDVKNPGKADVRLAYQVSGASWVPDYNLQRQVSKSAQTFSLETFGNIAQTTGENWENVEVTLSTARPNLGIARPEVSPIFLNLLNSVAAGASFEGAPAVLRSSTTLLGKMKKLEDREKEDDRGDVMLANDLASLQQADVEQGEVVTYRVKSRVTLASDGSAERIKLIEGAVDGNLLNVALPAQSPFVYMEGRFKNGKQPLLAGIVNVFSNGNYVGKQSIAYVPPAKDFQLSLGISNELTVERERIRDYEDDSGLIRSVRHLTKEYRIRAENLSDFGQQLVILEAQPVSKNEKIVATVSEQSVKSLDVKDPARIDRTPGVLEWHLSLASGKSQDVTYATSVEFSPGESVTGLERL